MGDSSKTPTVCLLTDFGLEDNYVGVLKGVIRSIAPAASVIDLTHGIPPQDVHAASFLLDHSVPYFPRETVFLCVVDPGVGSSRRKIALSSAGNLFVGPDNGLFTTHLDSAEVREIENPAFRLAEVSNTFHGRDVFAPVAAHLALGLPLTDLGPPCADPIRLARKAPVRIAEGWIGEVAYVDRYGNLVTNFDEPTFASQLSQGEYRVETDEKVDWPFVTAYAQIPEGKRCSVFGGFSALELSINLGSAARAYRLGRGARVLLRLG